MQATEPLKYEEPTVKLGFVYVLKNILWLFIKPSLFFKSIPEYTGKVLSCVVFWMIGVSIAIEKVDQKLMKLDFGIANQRESFIVTVVSSDWLTFFMFCGAFGVISALLYWSIGGWFYNLRLKWSGAGIFNQNTGRTVYGLTTLVEVLPHLISILIAAFFYKNYYQFFFSDELWSTVILVFIFWSIVVSYFSVQSVFNVVRWKAIIWFLLLPIIFYLMVFGLAVWLFNFFA